MNVRVIEELIGFVENWADYVVCEIDGGIELTFILVIALDYDIFVFFASAPSISMSRRVKFNNDSDSSENGVGNELWDLVFRVGAWQFSVLAEFRNAFNFVGEAILINDVPMKNVHFVIEHGIDLFLDWSDGQEVAWRVDEDSSPFVFRLVVDTDRDAFYEKFVVLILLEDLWICLQSTQKTAVLFSGELPSSVLSDKKRVCFLGSLKGKVDWAACHVDVEGDIGLSLRGAFEDVLEIMVDSLHEDWYGRCDEIPNIAGRNLQRSGFGIDGEFLREGPELGQCKGGVGEQEKSKDKEG